MRESSFNQHFLRSYLVPIVVLGADDTAENKAGKGSSLCGFCLLAGKTGNKQRNQKRKKKKTTTVH